MLCVAALLAELLRNIPSSLQTVTPMLLSMSCRTLDFCTCAADDPVAPARKCYDKQIIHWYFVKHYNTIQYNTSSAQET